MKQKKGSLGIGIGAIVIIVAVILVAIPGVIPSILGLSVDCSIAMYREDCICGEGRKKIFVPWFGVDRWNCETVENQLIDPDSPAFEQEAVNFVVNKFEYYCGDICMDLECGEICEAGRPDVCTADRYMTAEYGWDANGKRQAYITCMRSGQAFWSMHFLVESETDIPMTYSNIVQNNYCFNEGQGITCTIQENCDMRGNPSGCIPNIPMDVISPPVANLFVPAQFA